uniref:Serine-rich adhesin for platelets-like n=1 Tax=Loa loa TaxID=7209 RepID=A0A1I7VMU1_LOALO
MFEVEQREREEDEGWRRSRCRPEFVVGYPEGWLPFSIRRSVSSGKYHKRWVSAGNDCSSTTVKRRENVTRVIAPHTYGTSWNSVRWNKPLESDGTAGDGYWSRSMPFSESLSKGYDTKSSYSMPPLGRFDTQSASKNNIELKNSGPYIRERSARFGDSVLSLMNNKTPNRTSPRLPWLFDNLKNRKNTTYNKSIRNARENAVIVNSRWTLPSSSAVRSFQSEVRNTVLVSSSSSSTSTSLYNRSFLSNMSQTVISNHGNVALRTDRPWRRRMADAARLRIVHGDEIGGAVCSTLATIRARRNSIPNGRNFTNNNGDELRSSLNALKNYIDEQTTQHTPIRGFYSTRWNSGRFSEYMSRSYSPVRPKSSAYTTKFSKYTSISTDMLLRPLRSSWQSNTLDKNVKSYILDEVVRNSPIPTNICERELTGPLLPSKERTLRHQSQQRKLGVESNSSSDTERWTEVRKRRLRKRLKKKFNDEGRSENKQLLTSAEKGMMTTDKEISLKTDIRKDSVAKEKAMKRGQILDSSETSSLIAFPTTYGEGSELRIITKECDKDRYRIQPSVFHKQLDGNAKNPEIIKAIDPPP